MRKFRKICGDLLVAGVFAAMGSAGIIYSLRYTDVFEVVINRLPDRIHRKIASLILFQPSPKELLKLPPVISSRASRQLASVSFPPDFEVSVFANAPAVNHPVFISTAEPGVIFVSSDGNGSLDHKSRRGRVLRVVDHNFDGVADRVTAFIPDVDTPRGLVWDRDQLFLLHPPFLSVYRDQDGDGISDSSDVLVSGIGFPLDQRTGDHSSNGLTLAIDGWLYAAIGDFGFQNAVGADGKALQLLGGGVVRVRPDGSNLELWGGGSRNVFEVVASPTLDLFGRDNSGDNEWNVFLHHFSGLTDHGWPFLFQNFSDEMVPPVADFGGGSGTGATWVDEPGIPIQWNKAALTADWGRDRVYRHRFLANGTGFTGTQEVFAVIPRVTDLDVSLDGALYVTSWETGDYFWYGRNSGFVIKATSRTGPLEDKARIEMESIPDWTSLLRSSSHKWRIAAQRAIVKSQAKPEVVTGLNELVVDSDATLESRIAGFFTLAQIDADSAIRILLILDSDEPIMPFAIRAVSESASKADPNLLTLIRAGLLSSDPRTNLESVIAAGRLRFDELIPELIRYLEKDDVRLQHTAEQALIRIGSWERCFHEFAHTKMSTASRTSLARILGRFPVSDLVTAIDGELRRPDSTIDRSALFSVLSRIHQVESKWDGVGWGTRPDTHGSHYKPIAWTETKRIEQLLSELLASADSEEVATFCRDLSRNRIHAVDATSVLFDRANRDPEIRSVLIMDSITNSSKSAAARTLLRKSSADTTLSPQMRAECLRALMMGGTTEDWVIVIEMIFEVAELLPEGSEQNAILSDLTNATPPLEIVESAVLMAQSESAKKANAATALLLAVSRGIDETSRATLLARSYVEEMWRSSKGQIQLIGAVQWSRQSAFAEQIALLARSADPSVSEVARVCVSSLGFEAENMLHEKAGPLVGDLSERDVLDQVATLSGNVSNGRQVFDRLGCAACHTIDRRSPPKGPVLERVAEIYRRRELAEAILSPNRSLSQGFSASRFRLTDGLVIDGFVVSETPAEVTVRTIAATEHRLSREVIKDRQPILVSLMPEGLVNAITIREFASLVSYLESLSDANVVVPALN